MTDTDDYFDGFIYVDTETTGLDPRIHCAYEVSWAVGEGTPRVCHLPHTLDYAQPDALALGRYYERGFYPHQRRSALFTEFCKDLTGRTVVGANPAFDVGMLLRPVGYAPWKYRLFDIEAYAAGVFGWREPKGLRQIGEHLRRLGHDIEEPDHTAEADVISLRQCHQALVSQRKSMG